MNKAQLIEKLSTQLGSKKAATDAVDAVVDTITRSVAAGERVAITGFGVFEKVARPARVGRNPRTGATVRIKKTHVPKFKAGQGFKEVVSGARKLPKAAAAAARSAAGAGTAVRNTAAKKTAARPAVKKATATKTAAKKTTAKKTVVKKAVPAKRAPATKSAAGRTMATKSPAASTAAKRTAAKKLATKKTATKKTAARKA